MGHRIAWLDITPDRQVPRPAHEDDAKAQIEPFDALELDLAALWSQ
jgi:hypothetical protein